MCVCVCVCVCVYNMCIMYAYTMQAMQMGPEYSDTMEEEILKIRIDKADKYLRHAMNLLQLVRRAPASRFPCFPVLLNNEEDTVNLDMEAKVCPLLRDRAHRFEEESALLSLEPRAEDADGGSGARKEMEEITEHSRRFVSLLLQLNEHRTEWERGPQDSSKKRAIAERVLGVLKQALYFDRHSVEATKAEIVLAILALTGNITQLSCA